MVVPRYVVMAVVLPLSRLLGHQQRLRRCICEVGGAGRVRDNDVSEDVLAGKV